MARTFGRTSMESAAYGCATIISNNGGLPETFKSDLILKNVNSKELYKLIKKLILNKKLLFKDSKKNFSSVLHKLQDQVSKIDNLKQFFLSLN